MACILEPSYMKDSYGNALPSCLFGSFEEIHVVDCRYFLQNMGDFVREKGITDILFCNNLIHASMPMVQENYQKFLKDRVASKDIVTE